MRESALDQLHGLFDGHFVVNRRQKMDMVGHDHKIVQLETCSATSERNTSMSSPALRSDCSNRLPMLVFVVAKKDARRVQNVCRGAALRAGCAMAGAKAHSPLHRCCGPAKAVPLLQSSSTATLRARHKTRALCYKQLIAVAARLKPCRLLQSDDYAAPIHAHFALTASST